MLNLFVVCLLLLQMISTEVPVMFSKILEIFITELTMRSWLHTEESKRRTVQVCTSGGGWDSAHLTSMKTKACIGYCMILIHTFRFSFILFIEILHLL